MGESCWEIELSLRLGQTSTILVIYFCKKVFTLGILVFLTGYKRHVLGRFWCFYRGWKVLWCSWYSLVTGLVFYPGGRSFFSVPGIPASRWVILLS